MGGFQAQKTVWGNAEMLASLGVFSADLIEESETMVYQELFRDPEGFKERFALFFAAIGKQDGLYNKVIKSYEICKFLTAIRIWCCP
jgi:hypothetical protein